MQVTSIQFLCFLINFIEKVKQQNEEEHLKDVAIYLSYRTHKKDA